MKKLSTRLTIFAPMMQKILLLATLAIALLSGCESNKQTGFVFTTPHSRLMTRLDTLRLHGIMYGHVDDPFCGHSWQMEKDSSDTHAVAGDYPAVIGFDLSGIELGNACNQDSIPFKAIREEIIKHHKRGGIIVLSWHPRNPLTEGPATDVSQPSAVQSILKGGEKNAKFVGGLHKLVAFLKTLQTKDGRSIPYIFRPWDHYNSNDYWWGVGNCSDEEFIQLWTLVQDYMRDRLYTKPIWCFTTDLHGAWNDELFQHRYPGNDRVDMLGCDAYQCDTTRNFATQLDSCLSWMHVLSRQNNKMMTITECGVQHDPSGQWWSQVLLPVLSRYPLCFAMAGKNTSDVAFGAAQETPATNDFIDLFQKHLLLLLDDVAPKMGDIGRDSSELLWL